MRKIEIASPADSKDLNRTLDQAEPATITLQRGSLCWLHRP